MTQSSTSGGPTSYFSVHKSQLGKLSRFRESARDSEWLGDDEDAEGSTDPDGDDEDGEDKDAKEVNHSRP